MSIKFDITKRFNDTIIPPSDEVPGPANVIQFMLEVVPYGISIDVCANPRHISDCFFVYDKVNRRVSTSSQRDNDYIGLFNQRVFVGQSITNMHLNRR